MEVNVNTIKKAGWVCGALVSMISLGALVDGRYQTAEAASTQEVRREEGDINNRIEIIQLELKYLKAKASRDTDDEAREEMLRAQLAVLLSRITEIQ